MRTEKQNEASKRNASLSTGPRTAAGRRASSLNSLRHGLASRQLFIAGESPQEFNDLRAALAAGYPDPPARTALIDELARQQWFLMRANRAEVALLERPLRAAHSEKLTADEILALTFQENSQEICKLIRYSATINRAFHRALEALQKYDRHASKRAQPHRNPPVPPGFAPQFTISSPDSAGFAPQNHTTQLSIPGFAPQFTVLTAAQAGFAPQNTITQSLSWAVLGSQ